MNTKFCTACNSEQEITETIQEDNKVEHQLLCGHKFIEVSVEDSVTGSELLGVKKMGETPFSKKHKWGYEQIIGERVGKDGKIAFVHQVIDRVKNHYKKFVRRENRIIKDDEGELTNHGGNSADRR